MMAKLFDADALFQTMKKADEADPDLATCWSRGSIRRVIEGLPTIEATPVVHGQCKFCEDYDKFGEIVCYLPTENGEAIPVPLNYCPNCGAKMDGGVCDG